MKSKWVGALPLAFLSMMIHAYNAQAQDLSGQEKRPSSEKTSGLQRTLEKQKTVPRLLRKNPIVLWTPWYPWDITEERAAYARKIGCTAANIGGSWLIEYDGQEMKIRDKEFQAAVRILREAGFTDIYAYTNETSIATEHAEKNFPLEILSRAPDKPMAFMKSDPKESQFARNLIRDLTAVAKKYEVGLFVDGVYDIAPEFFDELHKAGIRLSGNVNMKAVEEPRKCLKYFDYFTTEQRIGSMTREEWDRLDRVDKKLYEPVLYAMKKAYRRTKAKPLLYVTTAPHGEPYYVRDIISACFKRGIGIHIGFNVIEKDQWDPWLKHYLDLTNQEAQ